MTYPPLSKHRLESKIGTDYKQFCNLKWSSRQDAEHYMVKVEDFNKKMKTGYDIRSPDSSASKSMKEKHQLKVEQEDEKIVLDNCKIKICQYPVKKDGTLGNKPCQECPRQMFIDFTSVDKNWEKWKNRQDKHKQTTENLKKKMEKHKEETKLVNSNVIETDIQDPDEENEESSYIPENDITYQPINPSSFKLRSSTLSTTQSNTISNQKIPKIPIRYGRKTLNPKVIKTITHVCANYKVSDRDAMNFIVDIANMIFDQEWTVEPDWEENDQKTCDKKLIENENTAQFEKPDEIENSQNHD